MARRLVAPSQWAPSPITAPTRNASVRDSLRCSLVRSCSRPFTRSSKACNHGCSGAVGRRSWLPSAWARKTWGGSAIAMPEAVTSACNLSSSAGSSGRMLWRWPSICMPSDRSNHGLWASLPPSPLAVSGCELRLTSNCSARRIQWFRDGAMLSSKPVSRSSAKSWSAHRGHSVWLCAKGRWN